jgi:hypothetical protein
MSKLLNEDAVIHCNLTFDVHDPVLQSALVHTDPHMGVGDIEERWKTAFTPGFGYPFKPAEYRQMQAEVDLRFARVKAYLKAQPALDACIARIKEVDRDDALFKRMIATPFTSTRRIDGDPVFDLELAVASKMRTVMEATEASNWGRQMKRGASGAGRAGGATLSGSHTPRTPGSIASTSRRAPSFQASSGSVLGWDKDRTREAEMELGEQGRRLRYRRRGRRKGRGRGLGGDRKTHSKSAGEPHPPAGDFGGLGRHQRHQRQRGQGN